MEPLSEQWMDAVTTTIAAEADLPDPVTDRRTVVGLTVTREDGEPTAMHLDVEPGGVALRPGAAGSGAAVLTCSAGTLARMYRGEVTSGDAFRGGLVALSGEIEALAGLEEVFDEVVFAMGAVARR